jgi:asparagine synthase (glutamine-hydrolysing)
MCGILGSINKAFDLAALNLMEHRGPDDFGLEAFSANGHTVHLGQRRLSILDLSAAGHQPMVSACGRFALIFNGEIYNHMELRAKLPNESCFKGHSDTETILQYLMYYGPAGVVDFNGIFAIGFLDMEQNALTLARDPFGVKPLYLSDMGGQFIFSSEIRPIKALLGEQEVQEEALASLLRLRYNASPKTLYKAIEKLAPGHMLTVTLRPDGLKKEQHYFAKALPKVVPGKKPDLIQQYGTHLANAVERQMLSDVEVGILLSGGIDSAVIAALAKKHSTGPIKAFTIGFEGEFEEDEIEDAAKTAAILGLDHHIKRISFHDFLGLIKECSRIVEEPLATTSMIPMYYLAQLAAEHVKVVLTGQGADEPLGGYTRYRSEVLRALIPAPLRTMAQPMARALGSKNEQWVRGAKSIGITDEVTRFLSVYEVFTKKEIEELIGVEDTLSPKVVSYFYELLGCASRQHAAERMMALDTRMNLSDDLLNYTDKITMNFSLECRVPMLDLHLVQFMESLPLNAKLNGKQGKIIHKEFARELLPSTIINRKKKGFQSPTNSWFREEMETVRGILLQKSSAFSTLFNGRAIAQLLEQHAKGHNREKQIFLLLGIYYWFESNNLK